MSRDDKNQSETRIRVNVQKTWRRSGEHDYLSSKTLSVFKPNIANVLLLFQPSYDYWSGIVHISSNKPWPTRETLVCDIYQMREKIRAELSNFPRRKWKQRREWSDSNSHSLRLITLHTAVAKVSKVKFVRHQIAWQHIGKQLIILTEVAANLLLQCHGASPCDWTIFMYNVICMALQCASKNSVILQWYMSKNSWC